MKKVFLKKPYYPAAITRGALRYYSKNKCGSFTVDSNCKDKNIFLEKTERFYELLSDKTSTRDRPC